MEYNDPTHPVIEGFKKIGAIYWPPNSGNKAAFSWRHNIMDNLVVLRSISEMKDGSKWIHVSLSRRDRMPEYWEMAKVKAKFIGKDKEAYQVFVKQKDHVNIDNYCLHLWAPIGDWSEMANLQNCVKEVAY